MANSNQGQPAKTPNKWLGAVGAGLQDIGRTSGTGNQSPADIGELLGESTKRFMRGTDEAAGSEIGSKRKGGRIRKTGSYTLHRGELVVPARIVKKLDMSRKSSRGSGRR